MQRCIPLTRWKVHYIGLLLRSEGITFALTAVDMTTDLLFAWPIGQANQHAMIHALTMLMASYSHFTSTHFTGQEVQLWTNQLKIQWKFHVPQAAGMIQ